MLFNSYIFILAFLPLTLIIYFAFNKHGHYKAGMITVLIASLIFYGYNHVSYLLLLVGSIVGNYLITYFMNKRETGRKALLVFAVIANLGVLFYFKYFNFFVDNINALTGKGWAVEKILLPLGISFFTFQQISYVVDCYKDRNVHYDFISYATYVSYFPQLVAGPIVTHEELIPQMLDENKKKVDFENLSAGLFGFALGLGKKVLIADTLSKIVNSGYSDVGNLSSLSAWVVIVTYTLQIYFDFSGYSDMATGLARMMNWDLPINFNSPYQSTSIGEFWERWHMTLTRFLTRYVYIPLGGSRRGNVRTYINILIVFTLSGLWHGADWTFVVWGICHGLFKMLERAMGKAFQKIPKWMGWIYTFLTVNLLWVYFRADSFTQGNQLIGRAFGLNVGGLNVSLVDAIIAPMESRLLYKAFGSIEQNVFAMILLILLMLLLFTIVFWKKNAQKMIREFSKTKGTLIVTVILLFWCVMSLSDISEFLYFNF